MFCHLGNRTTANVRVLCDWSAAQRVSLPGLAAAVVSDSGFQQHLGTAIVIPDHLSIVSKNWSGPRYTKASVLLRDRRVPSKKGTIDRSHCHAILTTKMAHVRTDIIEFAGKMFSHMTRAACRGAFGRGQWRPKDMSAAAARRDSPRADRVIL